MSSVRPLPVREPIISLERILPPYVARTLKAARNAIQEFSLNVRLSKWRPISTAPSNQELELRIVEDGEISTLEFPCLRTNAAAWINVDLGAEITIRAKQWRIWQRYKSPQPHRSRIRFGTRHAILHHARDLHAHRLRPSWGDAVV